jgi:hypothetical protein
MSNFNKFETQANEILEEAAGDVLNAAQAALKKMTPGSELFDGPGVITNKYDSKKNYYPNIRRGFAGLVNTGMDKASQAVLARINQLKSIDTWDPNVSLPPELNGIVSTQYSQEFMPAAQAEIEEAKKLLETSRAQFPRDNELEKEFHDIINTDVSTMSDADYSAFRSKKSRIRARVEAMASGAAPGVNQMSMLQKAHYQSFLKEFETAFEKWFKITRTMGSLKGGKGTGDVRGGSNQQVDQAKDRIAGTPLRVDGTIYRDQWNNFLTTVQNAIVGAGQQRSVSGANPYTILTGKGGGHIKRRTDIEYSKAQTLGPEILQNFHKKIMMPLFMSGNNNVLIYATPEQWDSISQGGRLNKAITGAGKEAWTAAQKVPKVRL